MPLSDYLSLPSNRRAVAKSDANGGTTSRLTPNQQATLNAIRRLEEKSLPRLKSIRRVREVSREETEKGGHASELRKFLREVRRKAQTVRARIAVKLPEPLVQAILEMRLRHVGLKAIDAERLELSLVRNEPSHSDEPSEVRSYQVALLRPREKDDRKKGSDLELLTSEHESLLGLVLPSSDAPPRLRAPSGGNQGSTQYRFQQLKERQRREQHRNEPKRLPKPSDR